MVTHKSFLKYYIETSSTSTKVTSQKTTKRTITFTTTTLTTTTTKYRAGKIGFEVLICFLHNYLPIKR